MAQEKGKNKTEKTEGDTAYPTSLDGYEVFGRIGRGAFASVYLARCHPKKKNVAIKVIELEDQDLAEAKQNTGLTWDTIQKEVSIMNTLEHANIVSCYASFCVHTELWLVIPLLMGSCLDMMLNIEKYNRGFIDEFIISTVLRDVLCGIECIHECGFVHRDIKAGNILMSTSGRCLLSDFGVSGFIIENGLRRTQMKTITGSLYWISPEIFDSKQTYSYKTDIWSLGITALELAFAKPPHADVAGFKVALVVKEAPAPTLQSMNANHKYSNKFKDFVAKCLQKDPDKRSSAKQLSKQSFIKQSKDEQYLINTVVAFANELKISQTSLNRNVLPQSLSSKKAKLKINKQNSLSFSFGSISKTVDLSSEDTEKSTET